MDVIQTITHELFTVKILHSGYGTPRPDYLSGSISIEPDKITKTLFRNFSMGYGFFNDRLICFVRSKKVAPPANEPQVPYLLFSGNDRIRFLVNSTNDFIRKTVVAAAGSLQVYQFSNQVNIGTNLFISQHEGLVNADDLENVSLVKPDRTCFAVIDIHMTGTMPSYELFNGLATQHLLSPVYKIQFTSSI